MSVIMFANDSELIQWIQCDNNLFAHVFDRIVRFRKKSIPFIRYIQKSGIPMLLVTRRGIL
jgi:hypothetical protein